MALVLTRHIGETILIGDTIRVTVVEIDRGRVRLQIDAPREVRVDRLEVRERKGAEAEKDGGPHDPKGGEGGSSPLHTPP